MNVVEMKLSDLRPYANNPRNNDKAVEPVANSIKEFGFKVPIVATSDGEIVNGHTRYKAALKLGLETVPVIVADDLSEEQIKAFRLADNKTAEIAVWDAEKLRQEIDDLYNKLDLSDFGFSFQIENISEEKKPQREIGCALDEANNYVVLKFTTETDWQRAIEILGLEIVRTAEKNPKIRRQGIGRVLDGVEFLDRLEQINEN